MEIAAFDAIYNSIVKLNASEGPSRNIFEPKFQAREQLFVLLQTLLDHLQGPAGPSLQGQAQLSRCLTFLGTNMIDTDEVKDGFVILLEGHQLVLDTARGVLLPIDKLPQIAATDDAPPATAAVSSNTSAEEKKMEPVLKSLQAIYLNQGDAEATLKSILMADSHPFATGAATASSSAATSTRASWIRDTRFSNDNGPMEFALEYLENLNAICVFLANDQETKFRMDDARKLLHRGEAAYLAWDAWFSSLVPSSTSTEKKRRGFAMSELKIGDDGELDVSAVPDPNDQEQMRLRLKLDGCHTTILFLLSQVYGQRGDGAAAAKYCHLTMAHQLLTRQEFSRTEWAKNAVMLSAFYDSMRDFGKALYCLKAGEVMMPKEPSNEETTGVVCWGYGRHYLNQLMHYAAVLNGQETLQPQTLSRVDEWWVDFNVCLPPPTGGGRAEILPSPVPQEHITTFEEARSIFREGSRWLNEALKYYVIDGCCTDHIKIQQDLAGLYKSLVVFEPDVERRVAMHNRRVQFFESVVNELNFQAYATLIRQILFDCGDVYTDILDLRILQKKAEGGHSHGKPLSDKRINELCQRTIRFFERFCETFKDKKTEAIPAVIEEENRVAFFRCLMRIAHLQSKHFYATPQEEYEGIGLTIRAYERAVTFATKNQLDAPDNEAIGELRLAREMVMLLPTKQRDIRVAFGSKSS